MKVLRSIAVLLIILALIEGFRLVTQAGLPGAAGTVQNDGYAAVGGIVIFVAGVATGYLSEKFKEK